MAPWAFVLRFFFKEGPDCNLFPHDLVMLSALRRKEMIYLCSEFLAKDHCPNELGMTDKNIGRQITSSLMV